MALNPLAINFPHGQVPVVDPATGTPTTSFWYMFQGFLIRTGGPLGIGTADVAAVANEALTNAAAAQGTANTALTNAAAAQGTANTALTDATTAQTTANTAITDVVAETARAEAAEALLAPIASPTFTGVATSPEYAVGTSAGPTWSTGGGVPSSTMPRGSLYSRVGGGVGSTLYVSQGGGTWNPVAGV